MGLIANKAINGFKAIGGSAIKTIDQGIIGVGGRGAKTTARMKRLGLEFDSDSYINRDINNMDRLKSVFMKNDGSYGKRRIAAGVAGSYIGVASAGRIASGGGIYKDSDGNTDLMGIPFI